MTVRKAKEQLAQVIGYLHLSEDSFSIKNGHLVSKDGVMDISVKELQAIIPRHGTVMGVMKEKLCVMINSNLI